MSSPDEALDTVVSGAELATSQTSRPLDDRFVRLADVQVVIMAALKAQGAPMAATSLVQQMLSGLDVFLADSAAAHVVTRVSTCDYADSSTAGGDDSSSLLGHGPVPTLEEMHAFDGDVDLAMRYIFLMLIRVAMLRRLRWSRLALTL